MRRAPGPVADGSDPLKHEVLALVGLVLLSDALFLAAYFLLALPARSAAARLGFTAVWTLVTLAIVLRSLARIRAERRRRGGDG